MVWMRDKLIWPLCDSSLVIKLLFPLFRMLLFEFWVHWCGIIRTAFFPRAAGVGPGAGGRGPGGAAGGAAGWPVIGVRRCY